MFRKTWAALALGVVVLASCSESPTGTQAPATSISKPSFSVVLVPPSNIQTSFADPFLTVSWVGDPAQNYHAKLQCGTPPFNHAGLPLGAGVCPRGWAPDSPLQHSTSPTDFEINGTGPLGDIWACVSNQNGNVRWSCASVNGGKLSQTIEYDQLANQLVETGSAQTSANASSGLPIAYSSDTPSVCTVNSSTGVATFLTTGTCTLRADQAGDATYFAAASVTMTFQITTNLCPTGYFGTLPDCIRTNNTTQIVDFNSFAVGNDLPSPTYGDPDFQLTGVSSVTDPLALADPDLPDYIFSWQSGPCTVTLDGLVTITGAGNCAIGVERGSWTYNDGTGDVIVDASNTTVHTIVIKKATPNINVTGGTSTYDGQPHCVTGTATGVGNAVLAGPSNGDCFTNVAGGTGTWSFAGDNNYEPGSGTAAIVINKATPTVTVTGGTFTYDGQPHCVTATVTGVSNTTLAGPTDVQCFTDAPGGSATYNYPGDDNYEPGSGSATVTINKATATVNVSGFSGVYDGQPHCATGTATGVNSTNLNSQLNLGSCYTNVAGGTASWSFNGGTNYNDASGTVSITITKRALTVTAANQTMMLGALTVPACAVTVTGWVSGENAGNAAGYSAGTCPTPAYPPTWGTYLNVYVPGGYSATNYSFSYVKGSLTVSGFSGGVGFLEPIRTTMPDRAHFKQGSTIPAKFRLVGTNGVTYVVTGIMLNVYKCTNADCTTTGASVWQGPIAYNGSQYIANVNTSKTWEATNYKFVASLPSSLSDQLPLTQKGPFVGYISIDK